MTEVLKIRTESFSWHLFQSIRTYFVYAVGAVFFSADGLLGALKHFKLLLVTRSSAKPWMLFDGTVLNTGVTYIDLNVIVVGILLLFAAAYLREKYGYARCWIKSQCVLFRWSIWVALFILVLIFGLYGPGYEASTFIYQGF